MEELLCRSLAGGVLPEDLAASDVDAIWELATRRSVDELLAALRDVLDSREREAKARMTADVALDNYSDPEKEVGAAGRAMIAASEAEKRARDILAKHAATGGEGK